MKTSYPFITILLLLSVTAGVYAQPATYIDSIRLFRNNYITTHDVLDEEGKKHLRFFPVDEQYCVQASFEKATHSAWFQIPTSGKIKKTFRLYGTARFSIGDTVVSLNIYQSQNLLQSEKYSNYLFLPFTDATTGIETYHTGRYIDLSIKDIQENKVVIDFNKAYNPSCAYVSGKYNCPIPPRENNLPVAVKAGEMNFIKEKE